MAIDGGGYRGVYAAYILKRIEEEYGVDWLKKINLIAGTSTGAIIAAALACNVPASKILDFYKKYGQRIFKKRFLHWLGLFASRYDNKELENILKDLYGDERKLGQIDIPLVLPASDIRNGCVHVLKSSYDKEFYRDKNRLVYKAVLASCSAPTYFDPYDMDNYLLADGGLWANNPALIAAIEAKRRLSQNMDNLMILSIGTGEGRKFYSQDGHWWKKFLGWGFLTRWGRQKFIEMLFSLQSQTTNNMIGLLFEPSQILRINFKSDKTLKLDDPNEYNDLICLADKDFTYNSQRIQEFLD
ncbi:MAG: CBASS cGAMP-activated phospholipase [Candidatus Omnitrophica bacterium]|nr:CBASS cGAMP-activated phospholipase [Candidatus Omnitrophota bacterium]MDD5610768.1 CBASS cGAMP-activated phospholipase [Candidatus Omnitrophota bacterium]